ncbi:MAG: hypothetical protein ACE5FG_04340 [Myxococcota bacterium]
MDAHIDVHANFAYMAQIRWKPYGNTETLRELHLFSPAQHDPGRSCQHVARLRANLHTGEIASRVRARLGFDGP